MNIPFRICPAFLLPALAVFLTLGCGQGKRPTGIVRGTVTYGSKHVAGLVKFVAEDGASGDGVIYSDGSYEVLVAPVGKCKVAIVTEHLRKRQTGLPGVPGPGMGGMPGRPGRPGGPSSGPPAGVKAGGAPKGLETSGGMGKAPATKYEPIPARYEDPDASQLTFDVQSGEQTFDITIK